MLITYIYTEHHIFRRGFTGHEHLGSFGIINMNGRIYDPNTASFFSPDPYVSSPYSTQAFNRYSYCVNKPLMYTDPSGEFIHFIIGAISGMISGWQIADAMGATGWKKFGYILGGAVIGAASAGVGSAVSTSLCAASTTATSTALGIAAGGATAGAISGGGFTALAGGNVNQIFKAIGTGALSGALGSYVGTYIGGDGGAFLGGFTSSGLNSKLNGASWRDAFISGAISGGAAFLSYNLTQYYNYKQSGSDLTFNQFKEISAAAQRSFIRGKEHGGWLTGNGVDTWPEGEPYRIQPSNRDALTITGEFHTHWDNTEGFSDIDYAGFVKDYGNKQSNAYVICRQNVYKYGGYLTIGKFIHHIPFTMYPTSYLDPYFNSAYFFRLRR